jgi:hypothetical protein
VPCLPSGEAVEWIDEEHDTIPCPPSSDNMLAAAIAASDSVIRAAERFRSAPPFDHVSEPPRPYRFPYRGDFEE